MVKDIGKSFEIGHMKNNFTYTGLNISKDSDGILTDQVMYINDLKLAVFDSRDRHKC